MVIEIATPDARGYPIPAMTRTVYDLFADLSSYEEARLEIESLERELAGAIEADERDKISDELYAVRKRADRLACSELAEYLE